jgi:hypothetical protein
MGPSAILPRLLAICCCCVVGACASKSISFDSVRLVSANDASGRLAIPLSLPVTKTEVEVLRGRALLGVKFSAATDLRKIRHEDTVIFLHSYFCDRGDNYVGLGGPGVYIDTENADSQKPVNRFVFFIDVARKASPASVPPKPGFDLSVKAENICFYVTAHSVITTYQSSVAVIPKAAIDLAFRTTGSTPISTTN